MKKYLLFAICAITGLSILSFPAEATQRWGIDAGTSSVSYLGLVLIDDSYLFAFDVNYSNSNMVTAGGVQRYGVSLYGEYRFPISPEVTLGLGGSISTASGNAAGAAITNGWSISPTVAFEIMLSKNLLTYFDIIPITFAQYSSGGVNYYNTTAGAIGFGINYYLN